MIWKGLGVLAGSAALVILGVWGLARVTVPDVPDFQEVLTTASTTQDGSLEFVPITIGGDLTITGARDGTMTFDGVASGPSYGFDSAKGNIFFETDPLSISQMAYDGLAFFPEPEDCTTTTGGHNEEIGLVAVRIECAELTDIRDNGSITVDGYVALPADMVIELDLPDPGGTVTVGDSTFEPVDPVLFIGPVLEDPGHEPEDIGLWLSSDDLEGPTVFLRYSESSKSLAVARVFYNRGIAEVDPGECDTETVEIEVINPQSSVMEVSFSCDSVEVSSHGAIVVEGDVVFQRAYSDFEP